MDNNVWPKAEGNACQVVPWFKYYVYERIWCALPYFDILTTPSCAPCTVYWEHVTSSKSKQTLLYMKFLNDMWPRNYQSSGLQTPYNCLTVTFSFNIWRNILDKLSRWNMGSDKITRSENDEIVWMKLIFFLYILFYTLSACFYYIKFWCKYNRIYFSYKFHINQWILNFSRRRYIRNNLYSTYI